MKDRRYETGFKILVASLCVLGFLFSCASAPSGAGAAAQRERSRVEPPTRIMGRGVMTEEELVAFFMRNNPRADSFKVHRLAILYREEGAHEGVNADVAFIQMCLETGFLRFGGLVTEDMNNFCGLGSIGPGQKGLSFIDERTGVRAHVQHLKAYASTEPLARELVDPRFRYVTPRGKAPDIYGLAGTWAADREYGIKLAALLERLYTSG